MLSRVNRNILFDAVGDPIRRKALAFAIYIKDKNQLSVFKDWSYRELGRISNLHPSTIKKYIRTLKLMRLIREEHRNGHTYLFFKKLRKHKIKNKWNDYYHTPKYSDAFLDKLDRSSIKSIDKGLMALRIGEYAKKTSRVRHLIQLASNPSKTDDLKQVKRARKICREKGLTKFVEHGLSYRKIKNLFHCGNSSVRETIALGESLEMFYSVKPELVLIKYIGNSEAKYALSFFRDEHPTAFATINNIYYQPARRFYTFEES